MLCITYYTREFIFVTIFWHKMVAQVEVFYMYVIGLLLLLLLLHPFNGLFFRTTWVSRYQKSKTSLDLIEARDDGVWGCEWHQLDNMQTICTFLQTDNHTNTSSLKFLIN